MSLPRPTRVTRGEHGASRWELAERAIPTCLAPHVRRIIGYEERAATPVRMRELPEPFVVLILEFGPPLRVTSKATPLESTQSPGGFVAGIGDSFADLAHDGVQRGVQVDLGPTGARRLFGIPMFEISNRVVALSDLMPGTSEAFADQLASARDWSARLDLVEQLLVSKILRCELDSRRVDWALAQLIESGGCLEIPSLASGLGISHKHLIHLFKDQVGVPPKLLARLIRFQVVNRRMQLELDTPWVELALAHGFSDQAHLAREIAHFSGMTPTRARAERQPLAI